MHIIFVKLGNLHNSAAKLLQFFHICKHSGIFFEKKAIYREFVRTERLSGACSRIVAQYVQMQGHQSRFHKKFALSDSLQRYNFFLIYARKKCEFEPKVVIFMQLWLKLIYEFEPKVVIFMQLWLKLTYEFEPNSIF